MLSPGVSSLEERVRSTPIQSGVSPWHRTETRNRQHNGADFVWKVSKIAFFSPRWRPGWDRTIRISSGGMASVRTATRTLRSTCSVWTPTGRSVVSTFKGNTERLDGHVQLVVAVSPRQGPEPGDRHVVNGSQPLFRAPVSAKRRTPVDEFIKIQYADGSSVAITNLHVDLTGRRSTSGSRQGTWGDVGGAGRPRPDRARTVPGIRRGQGHPPQAVEPARLSPSDRWLAEHVQRRQRPGHRDDAGLRRVDDHLAGRTATCRPLHGIQQGGNLTRSDRPKPCGPVPESGRRPRGRCHRDGDRRV